MSQRRITLVKAQAGRGEDPEQGPIEESSMVYMSDSERSEKKRENT
jgi:hypothetical protein